MPVGGLNSRSGGSGVVPPNLLDERKIPKFYQDAIVLCGANGANQFPKTALVYNLMVTSQLPRQVLGNIWSLVNRTLPGRLTRQEFYACLALIALAQKGESLSALCDVTSLPIPFLNSFKINEISTGDKMKGASANGKRVRKNIFKSVIPQFSTSTSTVQFNDRNSSVANCKQSTSTDYSSPFDDIGDFNDNYLFTDILPANNSHSSSEKDDSSALSGKSKLSEEAILKRMLVWTDCLRQGIHVFTEAIELLYKSNDSAREVFTTKRGFEYFQCLSSVNCVMNRVRASAAALTQISGAIKQDTTDDSLTVQFELADEKWDILKQLLERNVDDSSAYWDEFDDIDPSATTVTMKCGVCVQPIAARWESINFVAYNYHSSCANFYLNRVSPLLPQLC